MARFFIDRPVFAIVIALVMLIAGAVAGVNLPIAQFPQITLPTIRVSAAYPGANAEVVERAVAQAVEKAGQRRRGHGLHELDLRG